MTKRPTVWITRTQPGADESAVVWREAGFAPIVAPVLQVAPADQKPPEPKPDAILLFTSKNGVWSYDAWGFSKDHKVITVGDATKEAAQSAGFSDVRSASGASQDVISLIRDIVSKATPIIHCAGRHVRGRISETLYEDGYDIRRDLYYVTEPVTALPDMDYAAIDHVAIYSPLAAQTLAHLIPPLTHAGFVSISPATNAALGDLTGERLIAKAPNEAAMLALLLP